MEWAPIIGFPSVSQYLFVFRLLSVCTFGFIFKEAVDLGDGSVEGNDSKVVISSVQDEILTHDGQADEAEISTGLRPRRQAGTEASQTCAGGQYRLPYCM